MTKKKLLSEKIEIRVSKQEKEKIKFLANKFAYGNVSLWMIYCALNMPRRKIKFNDLEDSIRKRPQLRGPSG